MRVSSHIHDPRPHGALRIAATRYIPDKPPTSGLTLIVTHATGTHKETWEPLLEYLFALDGDGDSEARIMEAWSIECPNHGESAVLNEEEIASHFSEEWDGWEYPRGVLSFLESQPESVNFHQRQLVGLGHSQGGTCLVLLYSLRMVLPIISFILLDPAITKNSPHEDRTLRIMSRLAWSKRDTWASREAAYQDLAKQSGTRYWHPRALRLFTEKALRDHPASRYPDPWTFSGVTLSCSRAHEAIFLRARKHHEAALDILHALYREGPPVHLILSKESDPRLPIQRRQSSALFSPKMYSGLTDPEPMTGKKPTSVQWIENGGHMFVQTLPQVTAKAVFTVLPKTELQVE